MVLLTLCSKSCRISSTSLSRSSDEYSWKQTIINTATNKWSMIYILSLKIKINHLLNKYIQFTFKRFIACFAVTQTHNMCKSKQSAVIVSVTCPARCVGSNWAEHSNGQTTSLFLPFFPLINLSYYIYFLNEITEINNRSKANAQFTSLQGCLLYTSDAADER